MHIHKPYIAALDKIDTTVKDFVIIKNGNYQLGLNIAENWQID
jgi:hypothetical protein